MLAIAIALGASVCWGSGDFLGGLTTRRASLWAVIVGSQAVGLAGAIVVVVATGHGWPGLSAVWPVLLGGVASVVAISCFYTALAIGSMSIVAPISATSALVPFVVGLALGERPAAAQLVGVVLAAAGVLLVAHERPRTGDTIGVGALPNEPAIEPAAAAEKPSRHNQRLSIVLSLTAAVAMGLVLVGYDATARHDALWAMLGGRASSAIIFTAVFVIARPHLELHRSAVPFIVAVGLLDTGANGLFAIATTQGYLSIVSVIGSIYPVVTVLLAYVVLRERLERHQIAGAVATLAGIALIAAA